MPVKIINPLTIVKTGGSPTPTPVGPKDPYEVYAEERPSGWWPMPDNEDVNDNEMYLLYHIAKPNQPPTPGDEWIFNFRGTAGSTITIEYGAMVSGEFVPDSTKTETVSIINASTSYPHLFTMNYSDFPANDLSNGDRQVMIKISSDGDITQMIWQLPPTGPSDMGNSTIEGLVEFRGKATKISSFYLGRSDQAGGPCKMLFFSLLGENRLISTNYLLGGSRNLLAVLELNTSSVTNMQQMFYGCSSLQSIPLLDTSSVTNMQQMFSSCYSLRHADLTSYDLTHITTTNYQNFITSTAYNCVVKLDPTDSIPVAGLTRTFITLGGSQTYPSYILIEDATTMLPLGANATTVFGTNQYVYVVVPDSMYETYTADQYWATLGSRLVKRSETTLPSWYTGA